MTERRKAGATRWEQSARTASSPTDGNSPGSNQLRAATSRVTLAGKRALWSILRAVYHHLREDPPPPPLFTAEDPKYSSWDIGEGTYGEPRVLFSESQLKIGKYCSIADDVTILLGGEHRTDWVTNYPFDHLHPDGERFRDANTKGDVVIGHDVWIGHGACILSGVTIGNGAVIAAGSVVTKDVRPYEVVGGAPARTIRQRFPDHIVAALEGIAWWNWPRSAIEEALPLLLSSEAEGFVARYGKVTETSQ